MSKPNPVFEAIPTYLIEKRTILTYLLFALILGIIALFAFIPTPLLHSLDPQSFTNIFFLWSLFFIGFAALCICKAAVLLIWGGRHPSLPLLILTELIELVVIIVTVVLSAWGLHSAGSISLPLIFATCARYVLPIKLLPYFPAILLSLANDRLTEINRLRDILSGESSHNQNIADITINFLDKGGKLSFATRRSNVLYVEAADNYTNIHYLSGEKEEQFILHNSLKNVDEAFSSSFLLRCHRGFLVNVDNVKLLRREKDGMVIEMAHCERLIPVSKTYAQEIVKHFAQ